MNRTAQIVVATIAIAVIAVCIALNGKVRINRARAFSEPHRVQTYGDTNYVVRLAETTVGRTDSGMVVIVSMSLENPNPYELVLDREWFVIVDHDRDYFQPSTTGAQSQLIKVPANSVINGEMLSFVMGTDALDGGMMLKVGKDAWVFLKRAEPYREPIRVGEFRTFRTRNW